MQNEDKKILSAQIIEKESKIKSNIKWILEGFFSLFYLILKNPLDNLWWECISLIIQYFQLIFFVFDDTVSKYSFKNIVLDNMERKKINETNQNNSNLFTFYSFAKREANIFLYNINYIYIFCLYNFYYNFNNAFQIKKEKN
jgi:hypothetical protein